MTITLWRVIAAVSVALLADVIYLIVRASRCVICETTLGDLIGIVIFFVLGGLLGLLLLVAAATYARRRFANRNAKPS